MNKVILMGRLTRDPEVRYSQGEQATAIARYTVAVDRRSVVTATARQQIYRLCSIRTSGRVRREISAQRN